LKIAPVAAPCQANAIGILYTPILHNFKITEP